MTDIEVAPLTDSELISRYVESMTWRELRPTTIYTRTSYLQKFSREIEGGFRGANAEKVQTWLSRSSLQPQSRGIWLTTLHCAYKFWNKKGYFPKVENVVNGKVEEVEFDPTEDVDKPKSKKGKPHPIRDVDLVEALKWSDPLMACWLKLGALCGLRCCEIATVRREDVHSDDIEPWLNVEFGKGNKSRTVPLADDAAEVLRSLPMRTTGPLWDMTPQQMSKAINAHLHSLDCKTDAGTPATAHALRHYFGTHAYRSCLDLQLVANMMGHANTAITSVYAAADQRKASAVVNRLKIGQIDKIESDATAS